VRKIYSDNTLSHGLIGFDILKTDNGSQLYTTKALSSYAGHTLIFSLTCTLVTTTTSTVVVTMHREGSLYVAKPGYHLPEPQVNKLCFTNNNVKFQSAEDLQIYMDDIKDDKFCLSLFANHKHSYSFLTPDCPFLTLTLVTPYKVDCDKDQNNLTMCNRSDTLDLVVIYDMFYSVLRMRRAHSLTLSSQLTSLLMIQ
jgi:hypothetical protein